MLGPVFGVVVGVPTVVNLLFGVYNDVVKFCGNGDIHVL